MPIRPEDIAEVRPNGRMQGKSSIFMDYYKFLDYLDEAATRIRGRSKDIYDNYFNNRNIRDRAQNLNWYGTNDVSQVTGQLRTYLQADRLTPAVDQFQQAAVDIAAVDIDQKKKIQFTAQEIGIFSFDLASLGLIRVVEYFSPLLDKIVSGDDVRSIKLGNGQIEFYHVAKPAVPEHILEQKFGKLYSPLLNIEVPKEDALTKVDSEGEIYFVYPAQEAIPQHNVIQRQQRHEDGTLKFSSTWKKSFIYIPEVKSNLPQLDVIISPAFHSGRVPENFFWTAVLTNSVLKVLSQSNLKFRAYAGTTTSWGSGENQSYFVKVKDLNDAFDANISAILSGDPRSYRYNSFKAIATLSYDYGFERSANSGYGMPVNDRTYLKDAFMASVLQQQEFGTDRDDALNPDTKIVISGVNNEQEAMDAFVEIMEDIKRLER